MRVNGVAGMARLLALVQGQVEPEAGAAAGAVVEPDATLHELDQALADRETKTRAAFLARRSRVGLREAAENAAVESLRNAGAAILHSHADDGVLDVQIDVHGGPFG